MARFGFLLLSLVILGMVSPAFARDDGGFGSARFSGKAPAALGDRTSESSSPAFAKDEAPSVDPNQMEPAAGEEEAPNAEGLSAPVIQKEDQKEPDVSKYDLAP